MTEREDVRGERRSKDPQEIEADIAETRASIRERIEAISDRLKPEHIKEEAKQSAKQMAADVKEAAVNKVIEMKDSAVESVSHTAERAGKATFSFARNNTVPLALIGIGVGWLIVSNGRRRAKESEIREPRGYDVEYEDIGYAAGPMAYEYEPRDALEGEEYEPSVAAEYEAGRAAHVHEPGPVQRAVGAAKERVGAGVGAARERAGEIAHRGGDVTGDLAHRTEGAAQRARQRIGASMERVGGRARAVGGRTKRQLQRARGNVVEFSSDQPLVIGAAALAAGFGIGLLLPKTSRENEWMGPTRDRLVDEARDAVQEVQRAVKDTARDVTQTLKNPQHH